MLFRNFFTHNLPLWMKYHPHSPAVRRKIFSPAITRIKKWCLPHLDLGPLTSMLLGVYIDSKLTFNMHINNLCNKANMKINCLFRIRNFIGEKQAELLGNAYILSYFNYCPLIWMFCSKTLGKKINQVHRRCLKAIYRKYDFDLSDLLCELKIPSIHTKHIHFLLIEVFKSMHGLNPEFMRDFFQENSRITQLTGCEDYFIWHKFCAFSSLFTLE